MAELHFYETHQVNFKAAIAQIQSADFPTPTASPYCILQQEEGRDVRKSQLHEQNSVYTSQDPRHTF